MTYHITVIAENEIMLVYVDDTKVLSNRIFSSINDARLVLFAKKCIAETKETKLWRIREG